ncbi:GNAT family N-acetyltransferase [Haloplasma contractile]|uniref:Gcn5-related N-acetyltransferase domain protein n=1 Tax=Haloplasma contractile SSD-17B TaxID=1033810 RepID=F7Q0P2_9MOLU|nr:GNAT family N-acetyltransferase [Haloplasma contractile]ERJ11952.1 Gcn5-related N-acetyltransferase domain protein [Haloplasma contractile SSD-17B]
MCIEIIEVKKKNYSEFMDMINWRQSGVRAKELRKEDKLNPYSIQQLSYGDCLTSNHFFIYAAKVNNEMVGYINACVIPKPDRRKGTLFIDEVWTQPSYRNRGIARTLLNRVIELGEELNLWECRLTFDLTNKASTKIYREAGFKEKSCMFGRLSLNDKE